MPIYEYKGQQYDISTDDPAAAKAKILSYLDTQPIASEEVATAPPEPQTGFSAFGPAVMRGVRGLASLTGDVAPAMIAKAVGANDYAKQQMKEAAAYQKETEALYPSAVPSFTNIKGAGDALTYIVEAVGEAIPTLIPSLFTGGAAAVAGRGAVAAARVAAEKAATTSMAAGVTAEAAKDIALKAGVDAAKREALKYEVAGALVGSAAQNIPDVYQGLYEKGYDNLPVALAFGAFNSVLDAVTPINLLRKSKLAGIPENEIIGAWYKRAGKGALEGMVSEGATEAIQEMSSAAAEKFVDSNNDFFTAQNFERFINAGLKGGLGGAGISAATNVAFGRKEAEETPPGGLASLPTATPIPPTNAPIVATTTVQQGGKTSIKVTRSDGSVDIDGVQVTPPTGPVAPTGGIATLTPQEITDEESQDQQQLIDEANQILGTPAVTPVTVEQPQDITDLLPKPPAIEGKPSGIETPEAEQTETQRPAEPETPVITGGPAIPPVVTPKQPELNPPATPANPPATPAEKTDLEKIHEAYATYKGKDYQGTKELADFKVGRLQEVANEKNTPIKVWMHQGQIVTTGADVERPKGARLIGTINPVIEQKPETTAGPSIPAGGKPTEEQAPIEEPKNAPSEEAPPESPTDEAPAEAPAEESTEGAAPAEEAPTEVPTEEAPVEGTAPTEEGTETPATPTETTEEGAAPATPPAATPEEGGEKPAEGGTTAGPSTPAKTKQKQVWHILYKSGRQANGRAVNIDFDTEQEAKEHLNKNFTAPWEYKIKAKTIDVPVETTAGPAKPPKVKLTDEEKAKAAEEKKAADEAKAKAAEEKAAADKAEEERKKKLEEFNKQPMKVAMDEGDAAKVAELLYGKTVSEEFFPSMQTEGLIRIPVELKDVAAIETALKKYGFTINGADVFTSNDPSTPGPERVTISAVYKPEKVSIQGGGAEFIGNRKGKVTAPPVPKNPTDVAISKMLAAASKDALLDIHSNVNNSFGAMMYKEGLAHYLVTPADFLLQNLKSIGSLPITPKTQGPGAIKMALAQGKNTEVEMLLQYYVEALNGLQQVFNEHSRVDALNAAIKEKYIKDPYSGKLAERYTHDGVNLSSKFNNKNLDLVKLNDRLYSLFAANEDSTDQTKRIVKKDAEFPPTMERIIRRGMRDHRQGRPADVQDFIDTFGFFPGGIDFGNWVNQTERADHLNAIYDAMHDLADLSGISPKMLGLGQQLKLAVGAQGRGGRTAAHYIAKDNQGKWVNEINLTKTKGDGSLGHEWQHGLDFNLQRTENGKTLMEETASMLQAQMKLELVEETLRNILKNVSSTTENRNLPPKKALFAAITQGPYSQRPSIYSNATEDTQFARDARALDREENREPIYWASNKELLSRGFEAMLFDASKGGSPYLVGPAVADGYISKPNGYAGTAYPSGSERPILNEIFKQMLDQIDPETLKVKTYKAETRIVHIEELGYAILDQHNMGSRNGGSLFWYKNKQEAEDAMEYREGREEILTPYRLQIGKVNERILDIANRVDAIMDEMGLFKWPEIKNDSMSESMFNHMRQGWWPKSNRELIEYGIKAYLQKPELLGFNPIKDKREIDQYKIADFENDRVKLKQTQEDFEAAAVRYVAQIITDMRTTGSDTKAIYDHILGMYKNQPMLEIKSILSKTNNSYSTPMPIAFLAGMLARVKSTTTVLDPTGGNGMLVVSANPRNVTTFEIDPHRANNLQLMQFGKVVEGDATEEVAKLKNQEVDVVLAHPPASTLSSAINIKSWDGKEYKIGTLDQQIAAESLHAIANDGRAVLLVQAHPNMGTITSTDKQFLNWLYSNYNVADHFEIAGNLYHPQSASAPMRILVIAGRNQTENLYPTNFTVDRINTFDELWSRYVQTSNRSEKVVVGAGKKRPATGGANKPRGGVPTGDTLEDDENGAGLGIGEGAGVGEPLLTTGGGTGTSGTGGRGATGRNGSGQQQSDNGEGQSGGSGGVGSSGTEGGQGNGPGSGAELGGLPDLDDLLNFIDNLGDDETPKSKPRTAGPRTPRGDSTGKGGTRAPRAPKTTELPPEFQGNPEIEAILKGLDAAMKGTAPAETSKTTTAPNSQERLDSQTNDAARRTAQQAKDEKNNQGQYSRKGQHDYADVQPFIQQLWNALSGMVKDVKQRFLKIYQTLVQRYGNAIKEHLNTFAASLYTKEKKVPRNQTPVQGEPIDTASRVVYLGKSRFSNDGIYLPRAQSEYAYSALENLEAQVGDIDEFVAKELGYSSVEQMRQPTDDRNSGLAGYQVDGLALAIQANKLGKGFIIGDDTGVGKGRAAAAMLVWAKKNGKIPIFVTLNDSLYSAMYEDLTSIGHEDIKIGMTHTDGVITKDLGGGKSKPVFQNKGSDSKKLIEYITKNGALPKGMDALFTSYSQLNGGAGSPARQQAIASLVAAGKAVLVMDEAHNAAGVPSDDEDSMGQNAFFMSLLTGKNLLGKEKDAPDNWKPPSALYLSATFAKRPDNMPLYIHTNLRYAANTPEELTALFGKGVKTDVLQQVSSEMLVASGSMLRRERSYEGVKMNFFTDEENAPRDSREFDKVTNILRSLVNADRALKQWVKKHETQKMLVETFGGPEATFGTEGPNAFRGVSANPFTSVVHNYISDLLLSTKTQTTINMIVDNMNNGEKVVVGLKSTSGAALDDYVKKENIAVGSEIQNFGWQTMLQRAVNSTLRANLQSASKDPAKNKPIDIPVDALPGYVKEGYAKVAEMIKSFHSDLSAAPIDYIRAELQKKYVWNINGKVHVGDEAPAGVKARHLVVREITGRNNAIDYSGDVPKYITLNQPDRVQTISQFQDGEDSDKGPVDVLIINSAGATGISLHASVKAFDQRPRRMIVMQPHGDISVFIQLLGRIHRTGQVEWPSFTILATGIPAERRILAMLQKKLGSLKSNTSGGSSSTQIDTSVDFINQYGDVATSLYLNEHPEINEFLGAPKYANPEKAAGTDLAHKASGTAGLLSVVDQQEFFDSIEATYLADIELRNSTGTNALQRRVLPLNAEIIKENLIEEGLDNSNPFLADVVMAQFNVDVIGSTPTQQEIKDDIAQALNGRTSDQVVKEIDAELNTIFVEVRNQIILKQQALDASIADPESTEKDRAEFQKLKKALDEQFATLNDRRKKTIDALTYDFPIGQGFKKFEMHGVPASAVVIGIKVDKNRIGKSKTGNPYAPSNFQIILKRNIPDGRVAPTLATLEGKSIYKEGPTYFPPLDQWFALRSVTGGRTTRYIALGNILRAAQLFEFSGGEIAKFTLQDNKAVGSESELDKEKTSITGVVMPSRYKPLPVSAQPVRMRNAESSVQYVLAAWHEFLRQKYEDTQFDSYKQAADKVKPFLLDNLPDFGPFREANRYEATILRGMKNTWALTLDGYRPSNGFRVSLNKDVPSNFVEKAQLLVGKLPKTRNADYEMPSGYYIESPEKVIELVKFLHKNFPADVGASEAELARQVMKVEFQNNESKRGMLSRAVAEGGQSVEAVQSQLFPIEGITVNVVQSADNLPDDAAPSDVEGAWYSGTTVYLVADNLPNAKRVQEVLAHEAIGHAALESMLGPDMMKDLVKKIQTLEKNSGMIQKVAQHVDRTQPGLSAESRAKEIVAVMAERGLHKGLVQRVFQAVRNFLKKLGFTIQFSDGDVLALLRNAEKFVGGQFSPGGEGLYSVNYKGNPAPLASFQAPTELNKLDTFLYKYQDKHIDTKRILEIIQKQNVDIKDNWDPYLKEELYHGRVAKQTKDFIEDEFRPLLEDMNKRKITVLQFEEYLHNRHAKIRNAFIAERNQRPDMQDGGSGLFDTEVDDYMQDLDTQPELKKNFEELAEKVDAMVKETQDLMVSTGLEKQSTIDAYREKLPFYVPLKRDPDELEFVNASSGMGRGFNVKGSTSKAAIGSHKTVVNILGNLALEREKVVVRGEKALIGRALYALAIQNPNTNFWKPINPEAIKNKQKLIDEMLDMDMTLRDAENIIQESKTGRLDKQTGLVKYEINPMLRDSPNVLAVRINGEDRYVFFNPGNKTALRMVESLKNLDAAQMDGFIKQASAVTRFIAAVSTQYNPVFGAFNFFRDVQSAAINLSSTPIADKKFQVVNDSRSAVRAIYRNLRGKPATTPEMQKWMDLFEKYQNAGGATGFRDQFSKNDEKETLVERELGRLNRNNVKKAVDAVADWLSNYNDAMENAVRLSAFKAALDVPGMSVDRAASIAKNLTVNFNRKGASTQTIGALYAFFNAAVQGSARLAQTLVTRNADGKLRLSPAGMKIIAGGVLIGVAQTAILAMAGFGPDDPSEWIKEKNLIIPTGGGGYLTIPMPLGFNLFPNLGRVLSEYMMVQSGAMKGKRDIKKTVTYLATSILDTFNPLGSSTFAQTLTPTLVDPLVAVSENKDAFGRPISKEDRGLKPTPGYERSRDSANGLSQAIAYALNYVTGGGEKGIGLISPTADQLSYIAGQYTGGVGKLGIQSYEYAKSKITGDEVQSYQVPVAGKLYGDINTPAAISGKFYENLKDMSQHERIIKDMKGKGVAEYIKENPEAALRNRANYVENEIVRLKKEKKALVERNAPDEQIKRKDDRIKELMDNFNKSVIKLQ
jgi:hypothetical protein